MNEMPESFIVTVINASGSFEADLEIPSRLPFAEMKGKLLEILKILDKQEFYDWQDCALQYKNRVLAEDETIADVGAFDGSRLVAVVKV